MLSREQCQQLISGTLKISKADEAKIYVSGGRSSHLRFARNTVSTSGVANNTQVTITSTFGRRSGAVTINQLSAESLALAVKRSEDIARLAPEDPEHVAGLGPQSYLPVKAWHDATAADDSSARMAKGVALAIDRAQSVGLVAAGFARADAGFEAIGNSAKMFGYHRATGASFSTTVRTEAGDGSGWAGRATRDIAELDFAGAATAATDKAIASQKPRALAPGKYVTILEPACVSDLLSLMVGNMGRRSAEEGRSFFSAPGGATKLGDSLFAKNIHIVSDPGDPRCASRPWDGDGQPRTAQTWIDGGTVASLPCDRGWAAKTGTTAIAGPSNWIMAGASGTLADLIGSTKRGVLVTSLWYIRSVDPQTLLHTGLTRDGVFWIEDGKIAHPVNNFRWNDSPIRVLKNIEDMSAALAMPGRGDTAPQSVVPAIRVSGFEFSSVSDAV